MSAHDASRLGGHINKRHNTKQNAGPKMQLGKDDENLEEYYEGSRSSAYAVSSRDMNSPG